MSRNAQIEHDLQKLRAKLVDQQRVIDNNSSEAEHSHSNLLGQAESLLQESDTYNCQLFEMLRRERTANLELKSALSAAKLAVTERETKLTAARKAAQHTEEHTRALHVDYTRANAERK